MLVRLYLILSLFLATGAYAQHHHYLYIQTEPPQPFYLKMGTELLNSNAGGFLILPKLRDSSYSFIIGFPGNIYPPYKFSISSMKKDKGYSLKNFGEKGWGLFDLQTLEILMGEKTGTETTTKPQYQPALTQDAFTTILAAVIDDPELASTRLVGKEDLMVAAVVPAVQKSTDASARDVAVKTQKSNLSPVEEANKSSGDGAKPVVINEPSKIKEEKKAIVAAKNPDKKSAAGEKKEAKKSAPVLAGVKKISQETVADGMLIVYSDPNGQGKPDTVNILIPALKEEVNIASRERVDEVKNPSVEETKKLAVSDANPVEKKQQETEVIVSKENPDAIKTAVSTTRQDCRKIATDKDLTALKRRILTIREETDMVSAALKEFKQKCYNTDQIKNISFVFLTDEGKYKLMDAAYPYVYDPASFSNLESLLNDSYYINRFKALLR
jgi:hypothetical protein